MNQIPKLRGALEVAARLASTGRNIGNDGELGYALTRAGIYKFRGLPNPTEEELEIAIAREQRKPLSDQGPRTSARDLRRTLVLLGFLEYSVDSDCNISTTGHHLLTLPNRPHPDATSVWVDAVLNINLVDASDGSVDIHPALNMLRMIFELPEIEKPWLAFALEMNNDSVEELNRVLSLHDIGFITALRAVGASEYMAANAVKILPSLLEQLDLINIDGTRCALTANGARLVSTPPAPITPLVPTTPARPTHAGRVVATPDEIPEHGVGSGRTRTTEEQLHTAALLDERTNQHQELVRSVINLLIRSGQAEEIRVSDDAFDIVAVIPRRREIILIEAKTLRRDAMVQSRIALGQILFYEHFDILPLAEGRTIRRIVAFNDEPGIQVREFLAAYDTSCLVITSEETIIPNGFGDYFDISD